ncbi:MAG TPA: dihydrofolate reductase, partial [Bradyrhizobium sp.]|nr:dihydrofolate reductase [Bradyrhizobium sp.]
MQRPYRIEGYAIVSLDGMLANAAGVMPDELKIEADQQFFANGLDGTDAVLHGRHSHENQPHSDRRRRLILTRQVPR